MFILPDQLTLKVTIKHPYRLLFFLPHSPSSLLLSFCLPASSFPCLHPSSQTYISTSDPSLPAYVHLLLISLHPSPLCPIIFSFPTPPTPHSLTSSSACLHSFLSFLPPTTDLLYIPSVCPTSFFSFLSLMPPPMRLENSPQIWSR